MAKMKEDRIELLSKLSLQQIAANLRTAAGELRANVERITDQYDALSFGNNKSDIEVVFVGRPLGIIGGLKHIRPGSMNNIWAVQVYVTELGNKRHIELIALGEGVLAGGLSNGSGVLNLGASIEKRDKLATYLV